VHVLRLGVDIITIRARLGYVFHEATKRLYLSRLRELGYILESDVWRPSGSVGEGSHRLSYRDRESRDALARRT